MFGMPTRCIHIVTAYYLTEIPAYVALGMLLCRCDAGEAGSAELLHKQQTLVDKAVLTSMHYYVQTANMHGRALELASQMQRLPSLEGE